MSDMSFPPEWTFNPSAWRHRLPATVLALVGCGIACYLTLYQVGMISKVWEPFFGEGSRKILRESAIARRLPIPDAALGAAAYLVEAITESVGGSQRWRTLACAVWATAIVAAGLGLAALVLVASQVFWFGAYCTLCLASAACSLAVAGTVAPEVWATWQLSRRIGQRHETRGESSAVGSGLP